MVLLATFLIYIYYFGIPAIVLADLIIAIMIICTKDRPTKLLGIWMIVGSIHALLASVYGIMIHFSEPEFASRVSGFISIVSIVFGTLSSILFVLYVTKKYGMKLYQGIILILGSDAIGILIRLILIKALNSKDFASGLQYAYFINIISSLPSIAVAVIWFVIFFKNRHKEKELKLLWLIPLNSLIGIAFNFIVNLYTYFSAAQDAASSYKDHTYLLMVEAIAATIIALLLKIYVLVKGRKASEDNKLIIVDE